MFNYSMMKRGKRELGYPLLSEEMLHAGIAVLKSIIEYFAQVTVSVSITSIRA